MHRMIWSAAVVLLIAGPAAAQPAGSPKQLTVQPAGETQPALKYILLPEVRDLQPGNAALVYMRALSPEWWMGPVSRGEGWDAVEGWLEGPLAKMPRDKVQAYLPRQSLEEIDRAARRESCDWEMLPRLRKDGIGTLVPDMGVMRKFGQLLALRARLEMADGRWDQAVYSFQTGLVMGRHIAETPTVLHSLVGLAVANSTVDQLVEFVQQPGAPSLYWALVSLPRPLIDIRRGLQGERMMVDVHFPELKTLEKKPLTPDEMERLVTLSCNLYKGLFPEHTRPVEFSKKMELLGKVLQRYPAARKALLAQGRKAADLDALPMFQVVMIYHHQEFRRLQDDYLKWAGLPYWQGHKALRKLAEEIGDVKQPQRDLWPFTEFLYDAGQVAWSSVRTERKIAALACVEAVRLHVAATGKVPAALADITAVPVPVDPVTGEPFHYRAMGNVVTLYGPPPGAEVDESKAIHYEVTIKR